MLVTDGKLTAAMFEVLTVGGFRVLTLTEDTFDGRLGTAEDVRPSAVLLTEG